MAIDEQQIGPTVIVKVKEHHTPPEILSVETKAGRKGLIGECSVGVVPVERGRIVGKIGFEDIEVPVAVEVPDRGSHPCLLAAIIVKCSPRDDCRVTKSPVLVVVIED